jgi:hypothetical protein
VMPYPNCSGCLGGMTRTLRPPPVLRSSSCFVCIDHRQ